MDLTYTFSNNLNNLLGIDRNKLDPELSDQQLKGIIQKLDKLNQDYTPEPWNKGIPMDDERKLHQSRIMKGKIPWNKGSKWDVDIIEKIRNSSLNRKSQPYWTKESRKKYSKQQKGKGNNNWSGTYITPWGEFDSISEASEKSPMNMPQSTINGKCKNCEKIVKTKNKYGLEIGKTLKELGFGFKEAK